MSRKRKILDILGMILGVLLVIVNGMMVGLEYMYQVGDKIYMLGTMRDKMIPLVFGVFCFLLGVFLIYRGPRDFRRYRRYQLFKSICAGGEYVVPAAGEQVEKGTTVNYVLSKGKKTETVEVPTLSGLTRSQAEAKLSGLGLTANVTESYDSTVTKGYVISQSVTPGSQIEKGSTVDIVVSLGPENVTPDPPTDGDNNNGNDSGSNGGSSSGANH